MENQFAPEPAAGARRHPNRLFYLGWLLILIGVGWTAYQLDVISAWESTTATVLSVESFRSSDADGGSSTTYQPTIRFKALSGKSYTAKPGYRSSQFNFDRGSQVPIAYNPEAPTEFLFTSFMSLWALPLAASLLGAFIVYMSRRS